MEPIINHSNISDSLNDEGKPKNKWLMPFPIIGLVIFVALLASGLTYAIVSSVNDKTTNTANTSVTTSTPIITTIITNSSPITQTSTIINTSTIVPTTIDPYLNWKTFESVDYDIKLKYPPTWVVTTTSNVDVFQCSQNDNVKDKSKCPLKTPEISFVNPVTKNSVLIRSETFGKDFCLNGGCDTKTRNIQIMGEDYTLSHSYTSGKPSQPQGLGLVTKTHPNADNTNLFDIPTGSKSNFKRFVSYFEIKPVDDENLEIMGRVYQSISQR